MKRIKWRFITPISLLVLFILIISLNYANCEKNQLNHAQPHILTNSRQLESVNRQSIPLNKELTSSNQLRSLNSNTNDDETSGEETENEDDDEDANLDDENDEYNEDERSNKNSKNNDKNNKNLDPPEESDDDQETDDDDEEDANQDEELPKLTANNVNTLSNNNNDKLPNKDVDKKINVNPSSIGSGKSESVGGFTDVGDEEEDEKDETDENDKELVDKESEKEPNKDVDKNSNKVTPLTNKEETNLDKEQLNKNNQDLFNRDKKPSPIDTSNNNNNNDDDDDESEPEEELDTHSKNKSILPDDTTDLKDKSKELDSNYLPPQNPEINLDKSKENNSGTSSEIDDNQLDPNNYSHAGMRKDLSKAQISLFAQPLMLAVIIGSAVAGLLICIVLVMITLYRLSATRDDNYYC